MNPVRSPRRALLLGALLALAACSRGTAPPPPPAAVVALPAQALDGSAAAAVAYPAEIDARDATALAFRVPGRVIERTVRLGDAVHAGQVLARLEASDAQQQYASAQAALEAAEHRLAFARAQLERDRAQADRQLIATSALEASEDAVAAALAGRSEAAAQLGLARQALQDQVLRAPHDGLIASEEVGTGAVVAAGQSIYELAWSGAVDVVLDVPEGHLDQWVPGARAAVRFPLLPGRQGRAVVREVAPVADPQSRTYRVKLSLVQSDPLVRLGMTAVAALEPAAAAMPASAAAVLLPATALFHQDSQPAVWVVRPDTQTLALRPVTVRSYGERTVIVAAGLAAGETVVLAGAHTVYAGEHVRPVAPLYARTIAEFTASSP